mmetsp:Transcript_22035/g.50530  ORF Transcript_22035/g.50530 Transcript_22035/m.50530 type:complete len:218 (-) Transcript_22035:2046-2699(-)
MRQLHVGRRLPRRRSLHVALELRAGDGLGPGQHGEARAKCSEAVLERLDYRLVCARHVTSQLVRRTLRLFLKVLLQLGLVARNRRAELRLCPLELGLRVLDLPRHTLHRLLCLVMAPLGPAADRRHGARLLAVHLARIVLPLLDVVSLPTDGRRLLRLDASKLLHRLCLPLGKRLPDRHLGRLDGVPDVVRQIGHPPPQQRPHPLVGRVLGILPRGV